ncbi:MAG: glycosyltransferase family 4 protein [Chloroflexi bacterium]|nr:glycosyltransferase family 4 protein [Chloroflexota bacterium]
MIRSLRIGLITGEYPPMQGGVGQHCAKLASALTDAGHSVSVFSDRRARTLDDRVAVDAIAVGWGIGVAREIRRWAVRRHFDILNLHFQTAAYGMSPWVHFLPDRLEPQFVTTFHDLRVPYLFPKAGPVRPWIVRRLARESSGVICTNHEDFAQLAWHGRRSLIPIGSSIPASPRDVAVVHAVRHAMGVGDSTFVVAYFGFINHSKGVDVLLDAVKEAVTSVERPVQLWIVGDPLGASDPTNETEVRRIEQKIRELGPDLTTRWTGPSSGRRDRGLPASRRCGRAAISRWRIVQAIVADGGDQRRCADRHNAADGRHRSVRRQREHALCRAR